MKEIVDLVLAPLLCKLLSTYFIGMYSILVIYDEPVIKTSRPQYLDSLLASLSCLHSNPPVLQWLRLPSDCEEYFGDDEYSDILLQHVEIGVDAYVIIVADVSRILSIKYRVQQISEQRSRDKIFLFLCEFGLQLDLIFAHEAIELYPNHLFVVPSAASPMDFNFWTTNYASAVDEEDANLVQTYSSLNGSFKYNQTILYKNKLDDLMGAKLSLATITYLPYTLTQFVPAGTGNADAINSTEPKSIFYDGTEARLMLEFCRLRNCSLLLMPFPRDGWGAIENGTADGQMGAIYYHEVDVAIGCIYKWYSDVFDTSTAIAKSAVTLLVPGALPISYALTPILPFDPSTWLFLFVTMNVCCVLYFAIKWFSELLAHGFADGHAADKRLSLVDRSKFKTSLRTTYLEVVAILLQQAFNPGSKRLAVRTVYCVLLISGITLENAYTGGLKAMLTIPRFNDKIKTVHEFVEAGFHWAGPQIAWALSLAGAQVRDDRTMFARFETIADTERLHNLSNGRRYGIGIERLHANSYSFGEYVRLDSLQHQDILREDLYFEYTMAYAVRGWPLMQQFNQLAMAITEHGLLHHWEMETVSKYLNLDIGNKLRSMATETGNTASPEILRVAHIYGPLFMLACGIAIALIAFASEHIYHRRQQKRIRRRANTITCRLEGELIT